MHNTSPLASIIILTHNDSEYLRECIQSVFKYTADVPHEIILVDNASSDGSDKYFASLARFKNIRLIRNNTNRFFAAGNNQGILKSRGKYVALLNADVVVGPGWLSRMIECAKSNSEAGLVGPCSNFAAGMQNVCSPGYSSGKKFVKFAVKWADSRDGRYREVHRLIAFCLLIKREVIERVGLLDEKFGPGGYEDYDYCLRVKQAGYKIMLAENVFVLHHGGKGYKGMDYTQLRRVNREILARKWANFVFCAFDDADAVIEHNGGIIR